MKAPAHTRLLADIGGTNARFAWQEGSNAPIENVQALPAAGYATVADAISHYLDGQGRGVPPSCAIAIANPVASDNIAMTNHHWAFSIAALKARIGFERLVVINDFTALALALPSLADDEKRQVGGGTAQPNAAIGVLGPGTGLGVSGLLPDGRGGWVPVQGEGGHVTLPATNAREQAIIDQLARRHGHPSAERAVCGQGLVDLHRAVVALNQPGAPEPTHAAADITTAALAGSDAACVEAVSLMCAFLGTVAGNLALTLGARGGIYIGGGIVPRLGQAFDSSPFRARFEAKGRFSSFVASLPVYVIESRRSPAFLGAASALDATAPVAGVSV
jgi:glucokinase